MENSSSQPKSADIPEFKTKLKSYKKTSEQRKKYYESFKKKNANKSVYHCDECNEDINYFSKSNHFKTAKHQRNKYIAENLN